MLALGCASDVTGQPEQARSAPRSVQYDTTIVPPAVLSGLSVPMPDGGAQVVPCTTCHEPRSARPLPASASNLGGPHAGLTVQHGDLRCASCHDATQRDRLHLADGRSPPLRDAMLLCAQCHGPQKRDYDHGAHGGMRGHWDLSRGPRERNHCVACHDPHAPRFGKFVPVSGPRDRFTTAVTEGATSHE